MSDRIDVDDDLVYENKPSADNCETDLTERICDTTSSNNNDGEERNDEGNLNLKTKKPKPKRSPIDLEDIGDLMQLCFSIATHQQHQQRDADANANVNVDENGVKEKDTIRSLGDDDNGGGAEGEDDIIYSQSAQFLGRQIYRIMFWVYMIPRFFDIVFRPDTMSSLVQFGSDHETIRKQCGRASRAAEEFIDTQLPVLIWYVVASIVMIHQRINIPYTLAVIWVAKMLI